MRQLTVALAPRTLTSRRDIRLILSREAKPADQRDRGYRQEDARHFFARNDEKQLMPQDYGVITARKGVISSPL